MMMQQQQQVASDGAAAQQQMSEGSPQQQELNYQQMDQDYDQNDMHEQQHLDNGDGQEYGEEMHDGQGMQISNALAGQRASKKRAQDDVKLLANRIALLKLEEKKAWKKIEDTKKKAIDIMKVRQRNLEARNEKQTIQQQKAQEEREKAEKLARDR